MHSEEIAAAVNRFNPISLDAIGSVRLMNRVEVKYIFASVKLPDLLNIVPVSYRILEIKNIRLLPYSTTYFDTDDYLFYNQHVRGEFERYKIRQRRYEATNSTFLEVKRKTNKGRTIKYRIENKNYCGSFGNTEARFIEENAPVDFTMIKPALYNRFTRVTLAGLETKERITLDFNIAFISENHEREISLPYLAIAEIKKEAYADLSPFANLIKQLYIYPSGFSKYCVGSAVLNESLKKNMIKRKLLTLNKIKNEYS